MPHGLWHEETQRWWNTHWSHPCALLWRADDPCHERLCWLYEFTLASGTVAKGHELTEIRQLEDRLGLNPKARLQLRWMIVDDHLADSGTDLAEAAQLAVVQDIAKPKRIDARVDASD
jgi:hypothetical protein